MIQKHMLHLASTLQPRLGSRTTETVCIKVAIRFNDNGEGIVHIGRSSGSTWQFQRVYKSLMCLVEDLVESETQSRRAISN